jgi:toxin ParE1/3/4
VRRKLPVFRERHAEADLTEHILHLLDERPAAAARFVDAIEKAFQRLSEMPEVGARRTFKSPRLRDIRMWPVPGFENYLVFYRVTPERVEVIRVLHGARDISRIFEEET